MSEALILSLEDRMRAIALDLWGTDDLSMAGPGLLSWLREAALDG
ncbi:hypothetical protein PBI_DEWDROP_65 [Microbacterium phage Dewdrop]|nr:hypothetical protein PBI_LEAF_65 [Microbacterium phage Leaf]QGZ17434.1 hypothetical protein PBI_DEWDROP_65 [Microbacterium phage Dewdrop]